MVSYRKPRILTRNCWLKPLSAICSVSLALLPFGCSVHNNGTATGGVALDASTGCTVDGAASECAADGATSRCPAGVAAVLGDSSYSSSQLALLGLDGNVLSSSFVSTASTTTDGLAFALSGDIALPMTPPTSGRIVILDRYGTNVVTWIDVATAKVQAQLQVGTGFESNPQDYLETTNNLALVSRWGVNGNPGAQPFDGGNDLLLLDTQTPTIQARIAVPEQDSLPPRPTGLTLLGSSAAVVLQRFSLDYSSVGDAEVVRVDLASQQIIQTLSLPGVSDCGRLTPLPGSSSFGLACTGPLDSSGNSADLSQSALVLLDMDSQENLVERRRLAASDIAEEPLQLDFDFASSQVALIKTQTAFGGTTNNRLLSVNLTDNTVHTLATARPGSDGKGQGITFGSVLCAPGCSSTCLMADADQRVVRRFDLSQDPPVELDSVPVTSNTELLPRQLAHFAAKP